MLEQLYAHMTVIRMWLSTAQSQDTEQDKMWLRPQPYHSVHTAEQIIRSTINYSSLVYTSYEATILMNYWSCDKQKRWSDQDVFQCECNMKLMYVSLSYFSSSNSQRWCKACWASKRREVLTESNLPIKSFAAEDMLDQIWKGSQEEISEHHLCNIYIPLCSALRVLVHEGNLVNGRGRDNARAEGECIIRPRTLTRLPECTKARNALQTGI